MLLFVAASIYFFKVSKVKIFNITFSNFQLNWLYLLGIVSTPYSVFNMVVLTLLHQSKVFKNISDKLNTFAGRHLPTGPIWNTFIKTGTSLLIYLYTKNNRLITLLAF